MTWKAAPLWAFLLAFLLVSVGIKVSAALNRQGDDGVQRLVNGHLHEAAEEIGFVRNIVQELTVDGTFRLRAYRHNSCPNAVLGLLPLYRNAEGAKLLTRHFGDKGVSISYLYAGSLSVDFPDFQFWFGRHIERLRRILRLPPDPNRNAVIAITAFGECTESLRLLSRLGVPATGPEFALSQGRP